MSSDRFEILRQMAGDPTVLVSSFSSWLDHVGVCTLDDDQGIYRDLVQKGSFERL